MKNLPRYVMLSALSTGVLSACVSPMVHSDRQVELRNKLSVLQNDPVLSHYAPQALAEAEAAVNAVEQPQISTQVTMHNDFMAHRKIEIAEAEAREDYLIAQRDAMAKDAADTRLAFRTAEADNANRRAAALQLDLDTLHARPGPRGMVLVLGDVLFTSGQATLNTGANNNLDKLVNYMNQNPSCRLAIEGHTDNVGSVQNNLELARQRAETVMTYLREHGIDSRRMTIHTMGEAMPVASNNSLEGRRLNRRVEVTIMK